VLPFPGWTVQRLETFEQFGDLFAETLDVPDLLLDGGVALAKGGVEFADGVVGGVTEELEVVDLVD